MSKEGDPDNDRLNMMSNSCEGFLSQFARADRAIPFVLDGHYFAAHNGLCRASLFRKQLATTNLADKRESHWANINIMRGSPNSNTRPKRCPTSR